MKTIYQSYTIYWLWIIGVILVFSFAHASDDQLDSKIELKIIKQIDSEMKGIETQIENLKIHNENKINQRFSDHFKQIKDIFEQIPKIFQMDRLSFDKMVSNISLFGYIITFILVCLLSFLGYQNWNIHKYKKAVDDQIEKIKHKLNELNQYELTIKKKLIDFEQYEKEIKSLKSSMEKEIKTHTAFKEKKIVFIRENNDLDFQNEIAEIKEKGFNNIQSLNIDEIDSLEHHDCGLIIYYYEKDEDKLDKIYGYLKQTNNQKIPLIIYTSPGNKINVDIEKYRNVVIAKFPLTLRSHFNNMVIYSS